MFMPAEMQDREDATALAQQQHKEECERRLALRMNNADPDHKNGTPFPDQVKQKPD